MPGLSPGHNHSKRSVVYKTYESAEDLLNELVRKDPGNAAGWYLLSAVPDNADSNLEFKNALQNTPTDVKDDPYYLIATGKLFLNESHVQAAEKYFVQTLEKTKHKGPEILLAVARAEIASEKGDANQAIDLIERTIKKNKHNSELYTELGKAYRKLNNETEAFKAFMQAIDLAKKRIEAGKEKTPARIYKLIAYSYRETGDHANAFDYMLTYFGKAPDSILIAKDFILVADLYTEKTKN